MHSDNNTMCESEDYYEVESIKAKKLVNNKWKYLVKWKNFPDSKSTWEPIENLDECKTILSKFEKRYNELRQRKLNPQTSSFSTNMKIDNYIKTNYYNGNNEIPFEATAISHLPFRRLKKVSQKNKANFLQDDVLNKKDSLSSSKKPVKSLSILSITDKEKSIDKQGKEDNIYINKCFDISKEKKSPKKSNKIKKRIANVCLPSKQSIARGIEGMINQYSYRNLEITKHVSIDGDLYYLVKPKGYKDFYGGFFSGKILKLKLSKLLYNYCEKVIKENP